MKKERIQVEFISEPRHIRMGYEAIMKQEKSIEGIYWYLMGCEWCF